MEDIKTYKHSRNSSYALDATIQMKTTKVGVKNQSNNQSDALI